MDCLIKVWMDPTRTKLTILSLEWEGEISRQRGGLPRPSVFIKVKWMLEKIFMRTAQDI